jgi:hypothetical protein
MYFWCHGHFVANGSQPPYLVVKLSDQTRHRRPDRAPAAAPATTARSSPFVLLNACHAGVPEGGADLAFLGRALIQRAPRGVLGPQIEMPQIFAAEYALEFLTRYLPAGDSRGDRPRGGPPLRRQTTSTRWASPTPALRHGHPSGAGRGEAAESGPHRRMSGPCARGAPRAHVDLDTDGWLLRGHTHRPAPRPRAPSRRPLRRGTVPTGLGHGSVVYVHGWQTGPESALRAVTRLLDLTAGSTTQPHVLPRRPVPRSPPLATLDRPRPLALPLTALPRRLPPHPGPGTRHEYAGSRGPRHRPPPRLPGRPPRRPGRPSRSSPTATASTCTSSASQLEVLGRPHLLLELQRHAEPEAVRVDLGGVRPQRVVADLEVLAALDPGGDLVAAVVAARSHFSSHSAYGDSRPAASMRLVQRQHPGLGPAVL